MMGKEISSTSRRDNILTILDVEKVKLHLIRTRVVENLVVSKGDREA